MAEEIEAPEVTQEDPFAKYGGRAVPAQKPASSDPFSAYGGRALPKKAGGAGSPPTSQPSSNGFAYSPSSPQPYSYVTTSPQAQQQALQDVNTHEAQVQAQRRQQIDKANALLHTYTNKLSDSEKKALTDLGESSMRSRENESISATPEQEQRDYEYSQTIPGKIQNSVTYLAQKATKGGLQVLKGAAYVAKLATNPVAALTDDGNDFDKADKATDFLSKNQQGYVEDSKAMSNLGGLAEFLPSAAGAEATGGATFYLQGIGQGKETIDRAEQNGANINPMVKQAYILGNGVVNGLLMGKLGGSLFNSLSTSLKNDVVSEITANAIKEAAGNELTGQEFKNLLETGAKDWTDKALQTGHNFLKNTQHAVTNLSALNVADFALKKGVDVTSDKPVFNQNLGDLAQQEGETLKAAPFFGAAGSVGDISKLTPYSDYKNTVVEQLMHDPSSVDKIKEDFTKVAQQQNFTPEETDASLQHIDQIAQVAKSLPRGIKPEKVDKAVDIIQGRDELQKQLDGMREGRDKALSDVTTPGEELLQNKIEQANDKLREIVTGNRTTYSKGVGDEDGKFFKTINGKKEEISKSRYELENLERTSKQQSNENDKETAQRATEEETSSQGSEMAERPIEANKGTQGVEENQKENGEGLRVENKYYRGQVGGSITKGNGERVDNSNIDSVFDFYLYDKLNSKDTPEYGVWSKDAIRKELRRRGLPEKEPTKNGGAERQRIPDSEAPTVPELARNLKEKGEPGITIEPSYEREYGTRNLTDKELDNGNKYIVSRGTDGKVNGVLEVSYNGKEGKSDKPVSVKVAVSPENQRKGIGTALFKHAEEKGIDLSEVRGKNTTDAGHALFEANRRGIKKLTSDNEITHAIEATKIDNSLPIVEQIKKYKNDIKDKGVPDDWFEELVNTNEEGDLYVKAEKELSNRFTQDEEVEFYKSNPHPTLMDLYKKLNEKQDATNKEQIEANTKNVTGFKTSKGSTYTMNENGGTTRNKAAREDIGHEGDSGVKEPSKKTYYLSKEDAEKLGEIQTKHPESREISETKDGRLGVKYLSGKDKGKFESRTVVTPKSYPEVGLTPLEIWDDGHHFGNEITELIKGGKQNATNKEQIEKSGGAEHQTGDEIREATKTGNRDSVVGSEEGEGKEVKKTILTKRAYEGEVAPDVKKHLEEKGLIRTSFSQKQRSEQATEFINKFGEDASYHAVKSGDVEGGLAASILSQLQILNKRAMDKLPLDSEERAELAKKQSDYIDLMEKKGYIGGEFSGQLAYEYQKADLDFASIKKQVEDITKKPLTKEQEEKAQKLTNENENLKKQLEQAEAKLIEETDKAFEEGKKSAEEGKPEKKSDKAKRIADSLRNNAKLHKPNTFSVANPASLLWDTAIEIVAKSIEAGGKLADAVELGLEHIRNSDWYKSLNAGKKLSAENDFKNFNYDNAGTTDLESLQHRFLNKSDNKFTPEQARDIWKYMKDNYINNGMSYRDAISKVSEDLGLTWRQVSEAIITPKTKRASDEMWKKQSEFNRNKTAIRDWIIEQNKSKAEKSLKKISGAFRGSAVFGHGGIFVGTHSGVTLFQPSTWNKTIPAFFRGWKFAYGNEGDYERAMEELRNQPNFLLAQRAGLKNNPDRMNQEEFQKSQKFLGKLGLAGERGFNAIKVLRQDLFDYHFNNLTEAERQDPEVAVSIAKLVNAATGATNIRVAPWINEVTFAGGMEASRWGKLTRSPLKATQVAIKALTHPKSVSTADRVFAKVWASRVGQQLATYASLLAVNAAIQNQANPDNKVNIANPNEPDWLKFKFGDRTFDMTSGMRSTAQFIYKTSKIPFENQKELRGDKRIPLLGKNLAGYARGKLSPFYSTVADFFSSQDYNGNIMPYSDDMPVGKSRHLSWGEYAMSKAPLPISEAAAVYYQSALEHGGDKSAIDHIIKGIETGAVSGATGFRLGEYEGNKEPIDYKVKTLKDENGDKIELNRYDMGVRKEYMQKELKENEKEWNEDFEDEWQDNPKYTREVKKKIDYLKSIGRSNEHIKNKIAEFKEEKRQEFIENLQLEYSAAEMRDYLDNKPKKNNFSIK